MSDEEKKAVEELIARREYFEYNQEGCNHHLSFDKWETEEIIDTILNLIEKQSKEIEELKKPKYVINCKTNEITKLTNDFVSKDKIKKIIKEELPDDEICECCDIIDVNGIVIKQKLQSLL